MSTSSSQRAMLQDGLHEFSLFLPQRTVDTHLHRGFGQDALCWRECITGLLRASFGDPEAGCSQVLAKVEPYF